MDIDSISTEPTIWVSAYYLRHLSALSGGEPKVYKLLYSNPPTKLLGFSASQNGVKLPRFFHTSALISLSEESIEETTLKKWLPLQIYGLHYRGLEVVQLVTK